MSRFRWGLGFVCAALLPGCSAGETPAIGEFVGSAGMAIWNVRVEGIAVRAGTELELAPLVDGVRIGAVGDVLLHAGGDLLFVADHAESSVVRIDRVRGEVDFFGRSGEGPGELTVVGDLYAWSADSVAVFDWPERRLSIFGSTGTFGRRLAPPIQADVPGVPWPMGIARSGRLIGQVDYMPASLNDGASVQTSTLGFWAVGTDGSGTTPLFESEGASRFVAPADGGFTSRRLPFDPELLTGVVGDGVAVAWGAAELRIHDGAGALVEIWRFGDVAREPVTPRDESEYWAERIASAAGPMKGLEQSLAQVVPSAALKGAFDQMAVAAHGAVWLRATPSEGLQLAQWWVVDPTDLSVFGFELPANVEITAIGERELVGISTDGLGVTMPVLYPLKAQGAAGQRRPHAVETNWLNACILGSGRHRRQQPSAWAVSIGFPSQADAGGQPNGGALYGDEILVGAFHLRLPLPRPSLLKRARHTDEPTQRRWICHDRVADAPGRRTAFARSADSRGDGGTRGVASAHGGARRTPDRRAPGDRDRVVR